jgi:hypothetical protein
MRNLAWLIAVVVACGGGKSGDRTDAGGVDARGIDSGSGSGSAITIMGEAFSAGPGIIDDVEALTGAVITAYDTIGGSAIDSTTSGSGGIYVLTVENGFEGVIEGTASTYLDTYAWAPGVLTANVAGAGIAFVTESIVGSAAELCGVQGGQASTDGFIATVVLGEPADATVSSAPAAGTVCYDQNQQPTGSATETDSSGMALLFNVPAGSAVSLSATESGATFASHTVVPVAGAFTQAQLVAQ